MWIILVVMFVGVVASTGFFYEKFSNPTSTVNQISTDTRSVADNLMLYVKTAKKYAEVKDIEETITLDNNTILNSLTYKVYLLGNYRSAVIYDPENTYLIVSWDVVNGQTTSAEVVTSIRDILQANSFYSNTNARNGEMPQIYKQQNGCTATCENWFEVSGASKSVIEQNFYNICSNKLPQDYKIGKYNMLVYLY